MISSIFCNKDISILLDAVWLQTTSEDNKLHIHCLNINSRNQSRGVIYSYYGYAKMLYWRATSLRSGHYVIANNCKQSSYVAS